MAEGAIWQDIALMGSIFTRLQLVKTLCPLPTNRIKYWTFNNVN